VINILVASDLHLGYLEKDPIRGEDSFVTFNEVFQIANERKVRRRLPRPNANPNLVPQGSTTAHGSRHSPRQRVATHRRLIWCCSRAISSTTTSRRARRCSDAWRPCATTASGTGRSS
jgi:hypothetical protein